VTDGTVVEQGSGYLSNQKYVENRCLPCGIYNFTIHDSYGDGLIFGGGYNITIDSEIIKMSSGAYFTSESTLFHGGTRQCHGISLAPSSAPTLKVCDDDEMVFQLDLTTDAYGYETSWIISNVVDKTTILQGGEYRSNRNYIVRECLPCGTHNFTMYDSFGDGIYSPGGYSIQIDGIVIKNSTDNAFSISETTLLQGGSQCEKKCEDSKLKMKLPGTGRLKSCKWVSKKPERRCLDHAIQSHCPSTCKICGLCVDSMLKFKDATRGRFTRCEAVGRNPAKIASRCAKFGIKETCPLTCGAC
jgi:hypothetical protein